MSGMNIIILGPPGSGKGTQAVRISKELGLRHLSTGDILREAVAKKTDLGAAAEGFMKKGLLVPDDVMLGLIREELRGEGGSNWILDGFPRTLAQAEALSGMLDESGIGVGRVILVDVDPEVIVARLTGRRLCRECKAVYNLDTLKTEVPGRCDSCGGELVKRPDDEEETVRRRLKVYDEQTAPVVEFYRRKKKLMVVDGGAGIEEVAAEVLRALQ